MSLRTLLRRLPFRWSHDSMLFEVTPRCNLRCLHCYNVWKDRDDYPAGELPTDRAVQLVEKAVRESHCSHFTFTGGEPCLRDDLEDLVATAARHCQHINLITNGTLLDEPRVRSLLHAGVTLFELPLNGPDRETHNHMAGGIDCFDTVTRAAADIRYQGGKLAFVFVGTRHNIDLWEHTLELGIALGARGFLFNRYNAGGECRGRPDALMPSLEQVKAGLTVAESYAAQYGVGIGASIPVQPCLIDPDAYPHVGFGFCAAGTDRAYYTIDPVGNVRPCNHTPTRLGNLFDEPLQTIVHSSRQKAFLRARPSFCGGCRIETACQGGCKAAAEACYGDASACEPFLELNRERAAPLPV